MGAESFMGGMGDAADAMRRVARSNEADSLAALRANDAYRAEADRQRVTANMRALGSDGAETTIPSATGRMPSRPMTMPSAAPAAPVPMAPSTAAGTTEWNTPEARFAEMKRRQGSDVDPAGTAAQLANQEQTVKRGSTPQITNLPSGAAMVTPARGVRAGDRAQLAALRERQAISNNQSDAETKRLASVPNDREGMPSADVAPTTASPVSTAKYVDMARKAAAAEGVDPDKFVRLIHSESSFRPDVPSSAGADKGLGIAQIAAVHGLSDEQRKDPAVSLPFAAKLLAGYLKNSGGDWTVALQKYKGASSAAGKAAMDPVIQKVIGEGPTTPGQAQPQTQPPAEPIDASMVSLTQAKQNADYFAARAQNEIAFQRMLFNSTSDPQVMATARAQIQNLQQGLYHSQLASLAHAAGSGNQDALMQLAQVYGNTTGQDTAIAPVNGGYVFAQRQEDGRYKASSPTYTASQLASIMLNHVSPVAVDNAARVAQAYAQKSAESRGAAEGKIMETDAHDANTFINDREKDSAALRLAVVTAGLKPDDISVSRDPMGTGPAIIYNKHNGNQIGTWQPAVTSNGITTDAHVEWVKQPDVVAQRTR